MKSWYLLTILAVSIASLCACSKTDSAFEFQTPAIANEPLFSQDLQAVQNLELDDESRVLYESLENKCTQGNDDACEKLAHIYTSDYYMRTDKFSYGMNIYQDLCNKGSAYACNFISNVFRDRRYGMHNEELAQSFTYKAQSAATVNLKDDPNSKDYIYLEQGLKGEDLRVFYKDMCQKGNIYACICLRSEFNDMSESIEEMELHRKYCNDDKKAQACTYAAERYLELDKYEKALSYAQKGLSLGDNDAFYVLSLLHTKDGDTPLGLDCLKTSCDNRSVKACSRLAQIYLDEDNAAEYGLKPNLYVASAYQAKVCYLGNGEQCLLLAEEYQDGSLNEVNNYATNRYYMRVINQNLMSRHDLFEFYQKHPSPYMQSKLLFNLKRGCLVNGDSVSCTILADAYKLGKLGLTLDKKKAIKLLEYSCNQQDQASCNTLLSEY